MERINAEIAEIAGIFAADGSMQKEHISFWGNITEDRDHYDLIIKKLFKAAFNFEARPHEKKSNSVYGFYVCKKEIIKYFNGVLGYCFGSKTYTVRVPEIIMHSSSPNIWSSFLRGFCDTDGSLSFGKRYGTCKKILKVIHTYPRIQIKCVSFNIIYDMSELLNRLHIEHSVCSIKGGKINEKDSKMIQVSGVKNLAKWMDLIGFNNPVHNTKQYLRIIIRHF